MEETTAEQEKPAEQSELVSVDASGAKGVGSCPDLAGLADLAAAEHEVLIKGDVGFRGGFTAVVEDDDAYAALMHYAFRPEDPDLRAAGPPEVDFSTHRVLAATFLSHTCDESFSIEDVQVVSIGGRTHLDLVTKKEAPCGPGCFETVSRGVVVVVPRVGDEATVCSRVLDLCRSE